MPPYVPQVWEDEPAETSAVSAARLNHMEAGIAAAQVAKVPVTRTMCYSNGGQGGLTTVIGGSATAITVNTVCSIRIPIRLNCDTDSWTLKLRMYNALTGATTSYNATLDTVLWGTMTAAADGVVGQTGTFTGNAATTIFSGSQAISGTAAYTSLSAVTNPSYQFQDGVDHMLAISFHTAASQSVMIGVGQCWRWTTTAGVDPTQAGSTATSAASWIPIDWVLEYTTTNTKRAGFVVGDSIPEGTAGATGATISPTPLWQRFWDQWATRKGDVMMQHNCLYASLAQNWASSSYNGWDRQRTDLGQWDFAVIALGANDIPSGRTLAQLQGDIASVITNVKTKVGSSIPIYGVNVLPQNLTTDTVRTGYNNWLAQGPEGIDHMIDLDSQVRNADGKVIDTVLRTTDQIHLSYAGMRKVTDVLMGAVP